MKSLLIYLCLAFGCSISANGASILISGVQTQIFGSSSDVPGSGSAANYNVATVVGNFAVFDVNKDGSDYADLKVTYLADNGGIGSNMMIARTSNSQGLTNTGTLSILMNLASVGTASIRFDWYTPGSFSGGIQQGGASMITDQLLYTSFDIDFLQINSFVKSDIVSYQLNSTTLLTAAIIGNNVEFKDSNANSTYDNPQTAFSVLTQSGNQSHVVKMGKQSSNGPALFMFEFSDPPSVLTLNGPVVSVPEPTSFVLCAVGVAGLIFIRSRSEPKRTQI